MSLPISEGKCAKCGGFMLFRTDKIPFCSECEKRMCQEVAQKLPKLAKGKKMVLHSEAVEE